METKTTCPYCGTGCGVAAQAVDAKAVGERALALRGDPDHPANAGRLCSKGTALASTVSLEGRLLHPTISGRRASWKAAIQRVASRFSETIARHGPDSVAFYVSGQLLTEDYYVANKLMKGFLGSANIDTNSRLCMASAVAAHRQAFGADLVPGAYEDLDLADLVVLAGHNAAWTHPVLFRRMEAARRARGQGWIVIDPRRTETAEGADLHLALKPQTDVRLWNGLLAWLAERGALDRGFIARSVSGFEAALAELGRDDQSIGAVARDCDLPVHDVEAFYRRFAATDRTVTLFSQGANQSAQGVAKGLAILNAHLATGRIGRPGAAPFSITGQPNAMGGREVGGLANTLAAHMDFTPEARDRLARFWSAPNVAERPGLKAVDLFEAMHDGRVRAVWIMATNPAVSLPNAARVREALQRCPFVVVSDIVPDTDTAAFADVLLPALAWGEKDGTVTNSERRISRQRPLFPAPGEARADWRIVADVATAMGHGDAFAWRGPAEVFSEHARLTAFENRGSRLLDLGPLAGITRPAYDALTPVQWPVRADGGGTARLFEDGRFATPDGRARMLVHRPTGPARATSPAFPFALNTGRVRDHWHTLTRTGLAPELCRHAPEPVIDIHPEDAAAQGLKAGQLARLITPLGEAVAPVRLTAAQRLGELFLPMHWTAAFAPAGRSNGLIAPDTDPVSGQPELKHAPARISAYRETWRGFALTRTPDAPPRGLGLVWRRIPQADCHLLEFAGRGDADERAALVLALMGPVRADDLAMTDAAGSVRRAAVRDGRLERALFIAAGTARLPQREWLVERFADAQLDPAGRAFLLAGFAPGFADLGAVVCACRNVRERTLEAALAAGAASLDALCEATGAGVTCGSCRPELARLIGAAAEETRHAA
ncbi:MAG TPA: nitrate reductase [Caulobacteraceae bacterium]|nr:nitrate reductase [Caulobacteraceae bacterium]